MATVALVDSKAKRLLFSFWMYDGDVLLTSHPTVVKINKDNITVIIAPILGIIFAIIIIIIPIILWKKGLLRRKDRQRHQSPDKTTTDGNETTMDNPANINE
ncbi:hypothetical protein LSH36_2293g00003, partial [Paralvinella palmiformis]